MAATFRSVLRTVNSLSHTPLATSPLLYKRSIIGAYGNHEHEPHQRRSSRRLASSTTAAESIESSSIHDQSSQPQQATSTPILEDHESSPPTNDNDAESPDDTFPLSNTTPDELQNVTAIPWYLQVEAPKQEPAPLSQRQQIPELPNHPPEILAPLLQQISVDLGMDDLTILDLRHLDPPPALGSNLLMIIGTARSEKHLHVSADRLCRWLRTNYKLRPDADGLLGRNELKLKLKRKARRAKLVGAKEGEGMDDGVRTGWVCVNVGTVAAATSEQEAPVKEGFVGFGRQSEGVKIVVQMMVEEKRHEIDLERLWTGISKRQLLEKGVEMDVEDDRELSDIPRLNDQPEVLETKLNFRASPILSQLRSFPT